MTPQHIITTNEHVSPRAAEIYLRTSRGNRNIRPVVVKKYAAAMLMGKWSLTHQGIAFNASGHLIDGHHRLNAIIESGATVQLTVSRNVPNESFIALDQGACRNASDVYGLDRQVASVAVLAGMLVNLRGPQAIKPIVDGDIPAITKRLLAYCGTIRQTVSATPVRLAAVLCARSESGNQVAFEKYRILVLQQYEAMDAHLMAFNRHILGRNWSGGTAGIELMIRSIMAFSGGNRGARATEENMAQIREWAREQVFASIDGGTQ